MKTSRSLGYTCIVTATLALAACSTTEQDSPVESTTSSQTPASSLCTQVSTNDMTNLFSVRPESTLPADAGTLKADEEKAEVNGDYGCSWTLNGNQLEISVKPSIGAPDSFLSNGPIDVGNGVALYPRKAMLDDSCSADFYSVTGPKATPMSVSILPLKDLTTPTPAAVDWCARSVPVVKEVMRSIGWLT